MTEVMRKLSRRANQNIAAQFLIALVLMPCLMIIQVDDVFAQTPALFPSGNANVSSRHPIDWCYIEGPVPGSNNPEVFVSPVTSLSGTMVQSCLNQAQHFGLVSAICDPVLSVDEPGYRGSQWTTFSAYTELTDPRNGSVVVPYGLSGVATCGCFGNGPGTYDAYGKVGVGADAACYCYTGYEWDASTSSCVTPKYFTRIPPDPIFDQGNCCSSSSKPPYFGDPVNVATGEVFKHTDDLNSDSDVLPFTRYFNSGDAGSGDLSGGWRHSYSRNIVAQNTAIEHMNYVQAANTSSQYSTDQQACENGFAELQPRVPTWSGATATYYGNGNCQITKGGALMGLLTVYANYIPVPPVGSPLIYRVTRDDGQVIRFLNSGGIIAPATVNLKLQQTTTGLTITDANDNVEQYDANGKLLSVTSRGGVVQTMNYDSANRLSSVVDSFGHQLILNYDAQGHLSAVTRQ